MIRLSGEKFLTLFLCLCMATLQAPVFSSLSTDPANPTISSMNQNTNNINYVKALLEIVTNPDYDPATFSKNLSNARDLYNYLKTGHQADHQCQLKQRHRTRHTVQPVDHERQQQRTAD